MSAASLRKVVLRAMTQSLRRWRDRLAPRAVKVDGHAGEAEGTAVAGDTLVEHPAPPRRFGPPEHWLERIRQAAPDLLVAMGAASPLPSPDEPDSRIEPTAGRGKGGQSTLPEADARPPEATARTARRTMVGAIEPRRSSLRLWLPVRRAGVHRPVGGAPEKKPNFTTERTRRPGGADPEAVTGPRREPPNSSPAKPDQRPRPGASASPTPTAAWVNHRVSRTPFERTPPPPPAVNGPAARRPPRPDPAPLRTESSGEGRVLVEEFGRTAVQFPPAGVTVGAEAEPRRIPAVGEAWPQLPEVAPADEGGDVAVALRAWERAERLKHEQRGR